MGLGKFILFLAVGGGTAALFLTEDGEALQRELFGSGSHYEMPEYESTAAARPGSTSSSYDVDTDGDMTPYAGPDPYSKPSVPLDWTLEQIERDCQTAETSGVADFGLCGRLQTLKWRARDLQQQIARSYDDAEREALFEQLIEVDEELRNLIYHSR